MIIPNKFNGYTPDGLRTYEKGGGSNKAYKLQLAQQQRMQAAIAAINQIFNNNNRQGLYDQQKQAVYDLNKNQLDDNYNQAERTNRFALARNGLTGGSADIDAQADLSKRYAKGLVEAEGLGQAAAADLQQADETAKSNLISLAEAGLDSGSAANQASSALNNNYQAALGNRSAATIADYFNNMSQLYLANKIGQQVSDAYNRGYYGSNAVGGLDTRKGYSGS